MDGNDISQYVMDNLPQVILLVGGVLAISIALTYVKDRDSWKYKILTAIGLIFGIMMAVVAVEKYGEWRLSTAVIIAVAAFTLIIRPFRQVHFAAILALLVMVVVYMALGGVSTVGDIDISFLAENPARAIVAFIIGALVYAMFNFAEAIVKMFGKALNCWPLLFVLGCVCIVEAVLMFTGNGSIADYISTNRVLRSI